jgi:opacity protein-like surface antigen
MNKSLASVAALLLTPALLLAQDDGVRFGLKLSPNMSFVQSETKTLKSNGAGLGYTFGLMLELPIGTTGNYRFATGLNLNTMKAKWKSEYSYQDAINGPIKLRELETDVSLQYIELPLTVKLMTNEIGYMRYYAVVGAGNAFNVKAKADLVQPKLDQSGAYVVDFEKVEGENIQDDIALYKASLIVGAGAEYTFSGNTALMFGITYNNGFTNILDIEGAKAKAHYLELSLGVFF